jgi:serine/threonine protein kinase
MSELTTCPTTEQVRKYASGRLDEGQSVIIREHVSRCVTCQESVQKYESTVRDLGAPGVWLDPTVPAIEDSGLTLGHTPAEATVSEEEPDSVLAALFPNRQGSSLGWVDDYEVQGELGRGGMGIVFKGFDRVLHRVVAIKLLSPNLATTDRARRRFLREARAAAAINHPNIVTIHAVGEYRGIPYLVMEYVAGQSLRQRIHSERSPDPIDVIRVAAQIAEGLAEAHAHGVIHRDIKPANIMLEDTVERVKITDFGLAMVALDAADLTSANQMIGTPAFMSPEQVLGAAIDARSDLFSLGSVMYAMVTHHSPFLGAHTLDVIRKVVEYIPQPLNEVDPQVPLALAQVVSKLLEKQPANRFQSAAEVATVLREQLAIENQRRTLDLQSPIEAPKTLLERSKPSLPRARVVAMGAMVLVLGIIGLLVRPGSHRSALDVLLHRTSGPDGRVSGPRIITVAHSDSGEFRTIQEALAVARRGSIIQILDDATYDEAIVIADSQRLRDVTIESLMRATLAPLGGDVAALTINDTPGVTIRQLQLKCSPDQHGIVLYGDVDALSLDSLSIVQPAASQRAAIYVTAGTHGTAEHPVRLSRLKLSCGGLGVVIVGNTARAPTSEIRMEGCRIEGQGVLAILDTAVRDLTLTENIFTGGLIGLNLNLTQSRGSSALRIHNNTFYKINSWIGFGLSNLDQEGISVDRNLIVECSQVQPTAQDLSHVAPLWFHDNFWEIRADNPSAHLFAHPVSAVRWTSTDTKSPDYLRPADPAQVTLDHSEPGGARHTGAVAPAGWDQ